jgi:GR25 family glycosyltransferase involved in LPS biosynthesis
MLPVIYYINLDHRTDRKEHIENEIAKLDLSLNVVRIPAVYDPVGTIGCGKSHIKALDAFLDSEQDKNGTSFDFERTAIILEDDFTFDDKMLDVFKEYLTNRPECDVFLLTANLREYEQHQSENGLYEHIRVFKSFTTAGYYLTKHTAMKLRNLFDVSTQLHSNSPVKPNPRFCIDVAWWLEMRRSKFLAMNPVIGQIGYQYANFSDIEKKHTEYGC